MKESIGQLVYNETTKRVIWTPCFSKLEIHVSYDSLILDNRPPLEAPKAIVEEQISRFIYGALNLPNGSEAKLILTTLTRSHQFKFNQNGNVVISTPLNSDERVKELKLKDKWFTLLHWNNENPVIKVNRNRQTEADYKANLDMAIVEGDAGNILFFRTVALLNQRIPGSF